MSSHEQRPSRHSRAILVLGMHRSGTSALTRVLNLLGAKISSTLWSANEANRKGFWEDPRIFEIHDTLLGRLGRQWDDLRGLPQEWLQSEAAATARAQLVDLLRAEFAEDEFWIVKDPRICRLLPLWQQVLEDLDTSMHCVLALRHPDEVARSLEARNSHAVQQSQLAWLEHTAEAVIASRGFPRAVAPYDELMSDWEAVARRLERELDLTWPVDLDSIRQDVADFLSTDERHHRVDPNHSDAGSPLVERLFQGMLSAANGGLWLEAEQAAQAYLDSGSVFLHALDSKQEEFVLERRQWEEDRASMQVELEKLQHDGALVERVAARVGETMAPLIDALVPSLEGQLSARTEHLVEQIQRISLKVDELQTEFKDAEQQRQSSDRLIHSLEDSRRQLSQELTALRALPRNRVRVLLGRTRASLREHGVLATLGKIAKGLRRRLGDSPVVVQTAPTPAAAISNLPPALPAIGRLDLRVLLVAEMGLAQCRLYRVEHKQQMFEKLGIDSIAVSWTDVPRCRALMQTHSVVIFYRMPGFPEQLELIREAKRAGLATYWEVDDLIFDEKKYRLNTNLVHLDVETRKGIEFGIPLYRAALQECGAGIASTQEVAEAMREAGVLDVTVVENGLDGEALRVAARARARSKPADGVVRIVYGSGSRAHDADFRSASTALLSVLKKRPNVRLRIVGELNLPDNYTAILNQVERFPTTDYAAYMQCLAECDITIAPLEDTAFNDAKSNIKFLEGAIVGLPTVCSPRAAYRVAIKSGFNGFLAEDAISWEKALLALIDDLSLRESMSKQAYQYVMSHYPLGRIAAEQLSPLFLPYREMRSDKLRVLGVNIFFSPRSFGGATIVAEEIMKRLNQRGDVDYAMFTTLSTENIHPYELMRYSAAGGDVFGMGLPHEGASTYEYNNPHSPNAFLEAVHAFKPDVVHLHSVQGIGARIVDVCIRENIPYVVTLHDAWWICKRQFMVNSSGRYCYQRKVDLQVCASCVPDPRANRVRQASLRNVLLSASRLLTPSSFFRELFIENGFDADRVVVNKNGIVPPKRAMKRLPPSSRPLRFGFVGGDGPIKGAPLVRKAFRSLPYENYELHVVDNELNLGRRSIHPDLWSIPGTLKVIPAYNQSVIDEFFESIDVLLFPTQWKESFGLSIREALIRDVWVIATDAGGVVEDIVNGENGTVIPLEDDGTELAAAIGQLLADPARLDGYRNPYADRIQLFDQQADELFGLFASIQREGIDQTPASVLTTR